MSSPESVWSHQVESADGVILTASKTLFPYSDTKAVALTSAFIIAASLVLFYLQRYVPGARRRNKTPVLMQLALTLDFAIEYPLILAFHPCTLTYPRDPFGRLDSPGLLEVAAQVGVCMVVEAVCQFSLLRCMANFPKDDPAVRSTLQFLRSRAAILIAVGFLGISSSVTAATGRLHAVSMVVWILMQQQSGTLSDGAKILHE